MKIKTLSNRIQIKIEKASAGALDLGNSKVSVEVGEVIGIGDKVELDLKVGDKVMFKSWVVDICDYEGETYYFIAEDTNGICAIIK